MGKSKYGEVLSQEGLKNTRHRNAVLEILEKSKTPMTAEEVYLGLKGKSDTICLSTVYRTFEMLSAKGMVIKSNLMGDPKSRFEINRHEHKHHAICINCHQMIPIEGCPFEKLELALKNKTGFNVTEHRLEIYGYCNNCGLPGKHDS